MIEIKCKFPWRIEGPTQRICFFMDEKKPLYVSIGGPNVIQFYQKRRLMESDRTNAAPYHIFAVKMTGPIFCDSTYQRLGDIKRLMVGIRNRLVIPAGVSRETSLRRSGLLFCSDLRHVTDMDAMYCEEAAFTKLSKRMDVHVMVARLVMCTEDDGEDACIVLQFEGPQIPCDFVSLVLQHVPKFTHFVRFYMEYISRGAPTATEPDGPADGPAGWTREDQVGWVRMLEKESPAGWVQRHGRDCVKALVTQTVRADATLPRPHIIVHLMVEKNGLPSTETRHNVENNLLSTFKRLLDTNRHITLELRWKYFQMENENHLTLPCSFLDGYYHPPHHPYDPRNRNYHYVFERDSVVDAVPQWENTHFQLRVQHHIRKFRMNLLAVGAGLWSKDSPLSNLRGMPAEHMLSSYLIGERTSLISQQVEEYRDPQWMLKRQAWRTNVRLKLLWVGMGMWCQTSLLFAIRGEPEFFLCSHLLGERTKVISETAWPFTDREEPGAPHRASCSAGGQRLPEEFYLHSEDGYWVQHS